MSLTDAARRLLHPGADKWSPQVSTDPRGCWVCVPGLDVHPMCSDCHIQAANVAYGEARSDMNRIHHVHGDRSKDGTP